MPAETGAGPRTITDPADPALAAFHGLTDLAVRSVTEPASGLFIAEGAKVIDRALRAGLRPHRLLCSPRFYDQELGRRVVAAGGPQAEVLIADPALLREVTGYRVHRGALATFARPEPADPASIINRAGTLLVLVDLVDHTNVGAIFRNAAALGIAGVLVTHRCADPWYRRSVKVSMGAVFALPWTVLGPEHANPVPLMARHGVATMALSPDPAGVDISAVPTPAPRAILVGTEGPGLPPELMAAADVRVRIPMANGIDSLNVAAATAIACHRLGAAG